MQKVLLFLMLLVAQTFYLKSSSADLPPEFLNNVNTLLSKDSWQNVLQKASSKELDLLITWFAYKGDQEKVRDIIHGFRASELSNNGFVRSLINSAKQGHHDIFQTLVKHAKFNDISDQDLLDVFRSINYQPSNDKKDFDKVEKNVHMVMTSSRFNNMSDRLLGRFFFITVSQGKERLVQLFMNNFRYSKLSSLDIFLSLKFAAQFGYLQIFKMILNNDASFDKISPYYLAELLYSLSDDIFNDYANFFKNQDDFVQSRLNIIKALMNSNRYRQIPAKFLGEALQNASHNGYTEIVKLFINDEVGFVNTNTPDIIDAFTDAVENGSVDIVSMFMDTSRFNEISMRELREILKIAQDNNHIGVLRLLKPYNALKVNKEARYPGVAKKFISAYNQFIKGNSNNLHNLIFPVNKDIFALFPHKDRQTPPMVVIGRTLFDIFKKDCIKPLLLRLIKMSKDSPGKISNDIKYAQDLLEFMRLAEAPAATKIQQAFRKHQLRKKVDHVAKKVDQLRTLQELPQDL